MNFYITILGEFIAGLLVNMVTYFAKRKIVRKKISPFFNDSELISQLEEKYSYRLSNNSLLPCSAIDNFYVNANLLQAIEFVIEKNRKEELIKKSDDESENTINKYLPKVHEKLLQLWNGATQTYHSTNPDKERQFMCSIRELFTHLLHILAPDNDIKNWTSEVSYFHEGKPTRKTRIEYILRNITGRPLAEFKKCETKAAIEFINILNEGTHGLESQFSKDLILMKIKAESTLTFLLEIEFQVNR